MRFKKLPALLVPLCCAVAAATRAQEPLNPPVPLVRTAPASAAASPGAAAVSFTAAERAQALGFSSLAAELYRQLLDRAPATGPGPGGADRAALTLALATTLLDDGRAAEAEQALQGFTGARGAAWHLRAGLAAAQLKKLDMAKTELAAVKPEELSKADLAWDWFLQGVLFDLAPVRDITKANEFYNRAQAAAPTELARARFQLGGEQARLGLPEPPSKAALDEALKNYERFQGRATGYDFARPYAVMLDQAGQKGEAVAFLQRVLRTLPPEERGRADDFRLILGLIANRGRDAAGRAALVQLLETGSSAERQRQALQLLTNAAEGEPARTQLRDELDKLIGAPAKHPIKETLLLFRAQIALAEKKYGEAADRANELLQQFPGSPWRVEGLAVLTGAAWERKSYRSAAGSARQARAELAASAVGAAEERTKAHATLGVLEAEAWFRAGETGGDANDFKNAADAYAAALRERPPGATDEQVGGLMLQRVLAEIHAGSPDAAKVLDELARDPAFDLGKENRWQAEWTLARELQAQGKTAEAFARVNQVLAKAPANAAALPGELRARMRWLQARLSLEAGQPEQTLGLADQLIDTAGELAPALKDEILSTVALLKVEANFKLGREAAAFEGLKKLQEGEYAASDAAISSYLVEAGYYADPSRNKITEAQRRLTTLADKFPASSYAPYALYQAALQAERLDQTASYEEANRLLVDLVKKYPESELVFSAQLREGNLLMKLNQLPQAQQVYQELVNKFPQHRDVTLAELALADCLNAQSSGNPAYLAAAQAKFEELRDRVDAATDVRVEAGYKLGEVLVRRDEPARALEVWWNLVVTPFLEDEPRAAKLESKGRYWMSRTLIRTGEVYRQQGKLEEAKVAWSYVLQKKLPFQTFAKQRLAEVGVPEATP